MVQSEQAIACPTCGEPCAPSQVDSHQLRCHAAYTFRGVTRPIPETLAVLLAAVCRPEPDVEAWRAFETIATHECGPDVDAFLASSLAESLKRQAAEQRESTLPHVAVLLAEHCICPGLVLSRLAANPEAIARQLGWAVAERAPALLTRDLLEHLLAGFATQPALERLAWLERRVGPHPAIMEVREALEQNLRLRCSRCGVQLRRADMIQHLWSAHALVLDGRRVRDPWEVIDDWIGYYRRGHDETLLERGRELAERSQPEDGLERLYRAFLKAGLHHAEARAFLLAEAADRHASVCPYCFGIVPMPDPVPPAALSLSHGRLTAAGYRVEIQEASIFPHLEIATPDAAVSRLPLPGPRLTPQGMILFFVGPLILAAFLMALLPFRFGIPPLVPVLTFVLPAVGFAAWIRWVRRSEPDVSERAVGRAWSKLVPLLHGDGFSPADSAFVAGLAVESLGRPATPQRERSLDRVLQATEQAIAAHPEALHHLAALRALAIADAVQAGGDPVSLTVAQARRCFEGRLALPYGDKLVALWPREWRTRANLARLRVLLLDGAFEAGFEVRDLLAVGHSAPELGRVLGTDDPGGVARLRLLWSLRPTRPWDKCGEAETAFTLAARAAGGHVLAKYPDLLLYRAGAANGGRNALDLPLEILVSGRGVLIGGRLFDQPVNTIEVRRGDGEHVLRVGEEQFLVRGDPDEAAGEIELWLRYTFQEFVPRVAEVYRWRSPHAASIVRAWGTVHCPDCGKPLLARPGEVGIAGEAKD